MLLALHMVKYVLLADHPRVSRCYHCKKKNLNEFDSALTTKLYREYIPKGLKFSPDNIKFTLKREWAYFHIQCREFETKAIHLCPNIAMKADDVAILLGRGFSIG